MPQLSPHVLYLFLPLLFFTLTLFFLSLHFLVLTPPASTPQKRPAANRNSMLKL
uniref:ATPase subunit 8 n=1 Tax=Cepaea nemoralis TaxID=28835 RepID=Q34180_CEPNE|nr:ATPase subunit 8 [Cepaea nemoralis]